MDRNFSKWFQDFKIPYAVWIENGNKFESRLENKLEAAVSGSRKNVVINWSTPVPRP